MEIVVSLSASVPDYTEDQADVIMGLVHDKSNFMAYGQRDDALDELLSDYSTSSKVPLYRGLYEKELLTINKGMASSGSVKIHSYLSFSENENVSRTFADRTHTLLELLPGPKVRGFCYHQRATDYAMSIPLEEAFGGDVAWRKGLIDLFKKEKEWIFPFDFKFKVVATRKEGKYTYLTIKPA